MLYNSPISYNQPNVYYSGPVAILAPSLSSPIILNNLTLLVFVSEDYTQATTIAVMGIDYAPSGILELQVLDEDVQAFVGVDTVSISVSGTVSISI